MESIKNVPKIAESESRMDKLKNCGIRKCSESTDGGPQEIHQTIPDGLQVKKAKYGHGVFATKFFPTGSTVFIERKFVIPNEYAEFRLVIRNTGDSHLLNTETHSVQFSETERWLFLFDSFMNHSCDPTTIMRQTDAQRSRNEYQHFALKDINPGDEITCDYNLFEYDCHGKVIDKCLCGSPACIGRISGFRYLSISEQKKRLPLVDREVLLAMSLDPENKFIYIDDLKCPEDRAQIVPGQSNKSSLRMIASRSFRKGEVIFGNKSLISPEDHIIVIELFHQRKWLDLRVHTGNVAKGRREFHFFDSFKNHACEPSAELVYREEDGQGAIYEMIALRDIAFGDEITSGSEGFDKGLDGVVVLTAEGL